MIKVTSHCNRRSLLVAGVAATVIATLGGCAGEGGNVGALNVATYRGWTDAFFKDAGVAPPPNGVVYSDLGGGNSILEALLSGSVDYAEMSEIPPVFTLLNGGGPRQIALLRGDVNGQVIIAPRGSSVRSAADLRGKRVGYVRATTSHYLLLQALAEKGLRWTDIDASALSPPDGLTAFRSGRLDAWSSLGVFLQIALDEGAHIVRTGEGLLSGNYVAVASAQAAADPVRRAAIIDYMQREHRVYAWIDANPEGWAARYAELTKLPKQLFLNQHRRRSASFQLGPITDAAVASQQQVADVLAHTGFLGHRVDVAPMWDRSFTASLA